MTDAFDIVDETVGKLTDVAQSIATGQDFDERTKVLDAADGTVVNLANLYRRGAGFDFFQCGLGQGCGEQRTSKAIANSSRSDSKSNCFSL